ncbi:MAG: efflux RND transporter periplasmic adaptor subunit [Campylobacterota bacterium]
MKKVYIFVLIILVFAACEKKEIKQEVQSIKTVFATKPQPKDENTKRVFTAIATSNKKSKLSFKVKGNITYLKAEVGDFIEKDMLVAKLDSKPYEIKVSQIEHALSQAKAQLQNYRNSYERVKKLYVNQNASADEIDKAKATYKSALANVENINKQLDYAKLQLSYTKLYAPISGFLSKKFVQENENINAGTPVVFISDKLIDEVTIQIPQNMINQIVKNDKVKVVFDSLANKKFDAKVYEVSKYSFEKSKTYKVKVKLNKKIDLIKAGMSAEVYFDFESKIDATIFYLPSRSVLKDNKGHFVYLLKKQNSNYSVKKQYIKVGNLTSKGYEVLRNLKADDLVLKAGMTEVYEDMSVEITNKKELGLL